MVIFFELRNLVVKEIMSLVLRVRKINVIVWEKFFDDVFIVLIVCLRKFYSYLISIFIYLFVF